MFRVLIAGSGKIGSLIACLLKKSGRYDVHIGDISFHGSDVLRLLRVFPDIHKATLDFTDEVAVGEYVKIQGIQAVASCLPYFLNPKVAEMAKKNQLYYFDLTEDTRVTECVKALAKDAKTAFVPQCGLAPGFISIIANSIMNEFEHCHYAKLRVGALPQYSNNALHYALTWSTDGLINEYGNHCYGIENGKLAVLKPLEGLEAIQIDGCEYEAFNTSGGLGSMADLHTNKVDNLNYKTIRYPGHCEKMRFLMVDLKLNEDRDVLKRILEKALPKTYQDLVVVYVAVAGNKHDEFAEKIYVKKIYPQKISGLEWSAIQVSTAASVCAIVDLILEQTENFHGLVLQENFAAKKVLANRFGSYYA